MRKPLTINEFLKKAALAHENTYDYSMVNYVRGNVKVNIICKVHGVFAQTPTSHWAGIGCPTCGHTKTAKANTKLTTSTFIQRATELHNGKYSYPDEYKGYKTPLTIVCPVHGEFKQTPDGHLHNGGCVKCGDYKNSLRFRLTKEQFVERANQTHNCKYTYEKFEYINTVTASTITCPIHGEFLQKPREHLYKGAGCQSCKRMSLPGLYHQRYFDSFPAEKDKKAILYILLLDRENTKFVKVGITAQNNIHKRVISYGEGTYTVFQLKAMSLYDAFLLEQKILLKLKQYSVITDCNFTGHTECLSYCDDVITTITRMMI